jgi:hypothetical protein
MYLKAHGLPLLGYSTLEGCVGEDETPQLEKHLLVVRVLLVMRHIAQLLQLPEPGALVEVELLFEVLVLDRCDLFLHNKNGGHVREEGK